MKLIVSWNIQLKVNNVFDFLFSEPGQAVFSGGCMCEFLLYRLYVTNTALPGWGALASAAQHV